jgi:polyhydroxyalkanoate synthesis regulator phasin
MTDEHEGAATGEQDAEEEKAEGSGSRSRTGRMGDGIRQGIGVLSAFKDALEETIHEARERGDLSADRAKEVMKEALEKAQSAAEGAKERLDFARQEELDELTGALASLRTRVSALEQKVFGDGDAGSEGGEPPSD